MRIVQSIFWWIATLGLLFILDDLVFGSIFWLVAALNIKLSLILAFTISFWFQIWLVWAGLREDRSRIAAWFIDKLMLGHSNAKVQARESQIIKRAASLSGAIAITPLIGGVVPVLLLAKRRSYSERELKRLSVLLAAIYAVEFCLIHGGYGIPALLRIIF